MVEILAQYLDNKDSQGSHGPDVRRQHRDKNKGKCYFRSPVAQRLDKQRAGEISKCNVCSKWGPISMRLFPASNGA